MEDGYLIDTNILIYYFNGLIDDAPISQILKSSFNISVITKIEFLSWRQLLDDKLLLKRANDFISNATIYHLNDTVAKRAIMNRQLYRMKIPDAIIGATAQAHKFGLLTNNVKDFKNLDIKISSVDFV